MTLDKPEHRVNKSFRTESEFNSSFVIVKGTKQHEIDQYQITRLVDVGRPIQQLTHYHLTWKQNIQG